MKKIAIFIIIVLSSIGLDVSAMSPKRQALLEKRGQTGAKVGTTATAQKNISAARRQPVGRQRTLAKPPVAAQAKAQPVRPVRPGKNVGRAGLQGKFTAPSAVSPLVWEELSDAEKSDFNKYNPVFQSTVAQSSTPKTYKLWSDKVMKWAKMIIAINPLFLADYCIDVISANLDKTAESRGVDAEEEKLNISEQLKEYSESVTQEQTREQVLGALQKKELEKTELLVQGTAEDQFNWLLKKDNIELDDNGVPTREWAGDIFQRAKSLVNQGKIKPEDLKRRLLNAFVSKAGAVREGKIYLNRTLQDFVTKLVDKISSSVVEERISMAPENVNTKFYTVLSQVGLNWNNRTIRPSKDWVDSMIVASRNMMKIFPAMTIDEIEKTIGAQIFFVAIINNNQQRLAPTDEASLINFISEIKNRIKLE